MKNTYLKRFAIIGLPGSGKSTFASKLGEVLDIPVHHLDRHMFEPDGKKRDEKAFVEIQKAMLNEAAWVIEGCSFSTFEMRFATAFPDLSVSGGFLNGCLTTKEILEVCDSLLGNF